MTDEERATSILRELEYDYISYGNMQDDDAQGCRIIKKALEKTVPMKPKTKNVYLGKAYPIKSTVFMCPSCGIIFNKDGHIIDKFSRAEHRHHCKCGQAIDWIGVE